MIVRIKKPSRRYAETSHFDACCALIFGLPRPSFSNTAHLFAGCAVIGSGAGSAGAITGGGEYSVGDSAWKS
jgi:hypothetical protein